MVVKVTVTGAQKAQTDLTKALERLIPDMFVTVGIHEDAGNHESDDITNAQLGAQLHFGAEIDHPGGTSFGFASEAAAERNEVRFLKKGEGFAELGVTGPHKINIPARPWLDVGVASGGKEYLQIIEDGFRNEDKPFDILNRVGLVAVAKVQQFMTALKSPPNAPSTIKKKGSSNPLIDNGALRQSVTSKVEQGKPPKEEL